MNQRGPLLVCALALTIGLLAVGFVALFDRVEHIVLVLLIPTMVLLGAIPIALRVWRGTFDMSEVLVPYSLMFCLFYGGGAIFVLAVREVAADSRVPEYLDLAVAYCTIGFAAAMLGYSFAGRLIPARMVGPGARPGWVTMFALYNVGYIGELVVAKIGYGPMKKEFSVTGIDSLVSQLSFLATFSLFYAVYIFFAKRATRGFKILLFAWMIPTEILSILLRFGNKTVVMWALGLPIIAFWYARRRIPWRAVLASGLLVVFVVFPLYWTFRTVRGKYYSMNYRVSRSIEMLEKEQTNDYAQMSLETVARRLAIINSTAIILRECGSRVEYQLGKTLWLGVISVAVPRIVWPEKPVMNIGVQFGKTFRITRFENYSAVSMSMVGELYWNFHLAGVVVGMFLMGVWMRGLYQRFGANAGQNPLRLAMYVPLMYATVTGAEAEIGGLFGGLVKTAVILLVIERLILLAEGVREHRIGHASTTAEVLALR